MHYVLQEGSFSLPDGYIDRTVNMFTLGSETPAPLSLSVSRDTPLPHEPLSDYVARQVQNMMSRLPGYARLDSQAISLPANASILGIQTHASFMTQERLYYQRQAVFMIRPGCVLVFSATAQADFSAAQNDVWNTLLAGFTLHPAGEQE